MFFILGISMTAVMITYYPRATPTVPVALGTSGLIDGYHVAYGENLKAGWTAQMFRLSSSGSFTLDLRFDYVSENPTVSKIYYSEVDVPTFEVDFEYVTSVSLLKVVSVNKWTQWGDYVNGDVTGIIPIVPKFTDSKSCLIEVKGNFSPEIDVTKLMTQTDGFEFQFSWIRVFKDKGVFRDKEIGTFYYQWLQGNTDRWSGKLEVDKTYHDLSGGFEVYYPIPAGITSPLVPWGFDYEKWINENALTIP